MVRPWNDTPCRGQRPPQEAPVCPLCIATGSVLLTSAGSAGGLTAIAAKVLRARRAKRQRSPEAETRLHDATVSAAPGPDLPHSSS